MLLTITSKMFAEDVITKEQRGLLKELILTNEQSLLDLLNQYENYSDSEWLYEKIIKLLDEYQNQQGR